MCIRDRSNSMSGAVSKVSEMIPQRLPGNYIDICTASSLQENTSAQSNHTFQNEGVIFFFQSSQFAQWNSTGYILSLIHI